jgi:hypothetical protein
MIQKTKGGEKAEVGDAISINPISLENLEELRNIG